MFELMFGTILILFCAFYTTLTFTAKNINTNAIGCFIAFQLFICYAGITAIIKGIKMLHKDRETKLHGNDGYGIIADILATGNSWNGRRIYDAKILVLDNDGQILEFIERIGRYPERYSIGAFVQVKYLNDDANIVRKANECDVSLELQKLKKEIMDSFAGEIRYH